jgi:transcriptional regulator with PAS, ATPase and Fis domain
MKYPTIDTNKGPFCHIIGEADSLKEAISLASKVAQTNSTVLLLGETGTGKELFARAIHESSPRSSGPFVALNCSAFPPNLLESELFGFSQGAFTGADRQKSGLIETAEDGSLFLDEIGEMPVALQAKLLRVLETGEYFRLGDTKPARADVRIISATNRSLVNSVEAGVFRGDLYYRLAVFPIELPSLRDRKNDIPLLAAHFLQRFSAKNGRAIDGFSDGCMEALRSYDWKGNIRELKNVIERAVILCSGPKITTEQISLPVTRSHHDDTLQEGETFALDKAEKRHIEQVLHLTGGNKAAAARLMKIALTTLYRKLRHFDLE